MPSKVNQFKDIELEYDAPAGFTLLFSTDMPGGAMATRKTITVPLSTGRKTGTFPLDTTGVMPEGTMCKLSASSTGVVRLFGGHIRVRNIGTYFDGSNSETWETQEITLTI